MDFLLYIPCVIVIILFYTGVLVPSYVVERSAVTRSSNPFYAAAIEELDRIDGTKIPTFDGDEVEWVPNPNSPY